MGRSRKVRRAYTRQFVPRGEQERAKQRHRRPHRPPLAEAEIPANGRSGSVQSTRHFIQRGSATASLGPQDEHFLSNPPTRHLCLLAVIPASDQIPPRRPSHLRTVLILY